MEIERQRIEQSCARAALYHYLSTLFVYPDRAAWETLQNTSVEDLESVFSRLGWSAKKSVPLQKRLQEMTREKFEAEHVAIFGHTAAGELRPYEAGYGTNHVFQETQCLADITGFYRAFGLEPSEAQRERPDHIAVELEFMHVLALKEGYALAHLWAEQADLCRRAETDFLRDHLGQWAPSFLKSLSDRTREGVFESVADVTATCFEAHCHESGVALGATDLDLSPTGAEPEGINFSCAASCLGGMTESARR